jgi:hypothetical protein
MIPALAAGQAVASATEPCPHPAARARAVIVVGRYALCMACKRGFERIGQQFELRQLGPREVVAQVVEMGYTRRNATFYLLGLVALRLRVRLGFAKAGR